MKTISWFSAGVSSAVATKLVIDTIDQIIYTHIDDQHLDTMRFIEDCEKWFNKKITILQSPYRNVENACLGSGIRGGSGYVNGPGGVRCSMYLKKRVRKEWECKHEKEKITYIWGMDVSEKNRCDGIRNLMPRFNHIFPLVDKNITKEQAHKILKASEIKRPMMYDLGYNNNNCIGCVKGGMGYWNKIRIDFPDVFERRAKLERRIGGTCIKGVYLDELDETRGRNLKPICEDCGIFCEMLGVD